MKKVISILLSFLFLCSSALVYGQDIYVKTYDAPMSLGTRPAFELRFPDTKDKRVEKLWKDFVKDRYDGKLKCNKKTDEHYVKGLKATSVDLQPFDLYTKIEKDGDDVVMQSWFDLGSAFLNERDQPTSAESVKRALQDFYLLVRRAQVTDNVDELEDQLKDARKDLGKLEDKNADLRKDIKDYQEKIRDAEKDMVENDKKQVEACSKVEARQRSLEEVQTRLREVGRKN